MLQRHPSVTIDQTLRLDLVLTGKTQHRISACSFTSESFIDCFIGTEDGRIEECTFASVNFISCVFDFNFIIDSIFINCRFEKCEFYDIGDKNPFWFCDGVAKDIMHLPEFEEDEELELSDIDLQLLVLERFFQVDGRTRRMCLLSRLKKEIRMDEKTFRKTLDFLNRKKMILLNGDKAFISNDGAHFYSEHRDKINI